jgi:uncharacterized BrkB/YihY/UPF0761 family membrane protein
MVDGAAGLAFYMLFSLIPMLLIVGAIINLLGADAANNLVDLAGDEGASASLEGALDDALDTPYERAVGCDSGIRCSARCSARPAMWL